MDRDRALSNWFAFTDIMRKLDTPRDLGVFKQDQGYYIPNKKNKVRKRPKRNKKYGVNK